MGEETCRKREVLCKGLEPGMAAGALSQGGQTGPL